MPAAAMRGRALSLLGRLLAATLAVGQLAAAYTLDPDSTDSIKSTARFIAEDLMSFYDGYQPGRTPGLLPDPYYWWEAGALMGAMIDYWYYTGDSTWNAVTTQGLLHQVGPYNDYMPPNQTRTEGNDDQGFWGLAVMSAAEHNYPNPPADQPQWLALAQAVFNTQAARWDTEHCNGGLRWQIFQWNNGYNYKNTISQACFFALAGRLALYTGNSSYAEWADRTWDWMVGAKFIDDSYYVYDGAHIETNCTNIVPYQWTYNAGGFILGAAAMYNYTESPVWKNRLDGLLKGAEVFFTGNNSNIMTEVACETVKLCNLDQQSFKAYLSRWLAAITKFAPYTYSKVMPWIRASSVAAAAQCKGGANGRMCGLVWTDFGVWDGMTGVGQQMAAMQIVLGNMIQISSAPVQQDNGGTSQGDPGAGGADIGRTEYVPDFRRLNGGDYFGAALLTLLLVAGMIVTIAFMLIDETSDKTLKERWADTRATWASGGAVALLTKKQRPGEVLSEKGKGMMDSSSERSSTGDKFGAVTVLPLKHESSKAQGAEITVTQHSYGPQHGRHGSFPPIGGMAASFVDGEGSVRPPPPAMEQNRRLSDPRHIGGGHSRRKSLRKSQGPPGFV